MCALAALDDPGFNEVLERAGVDPAEGLQVIALDRLPSRPFDAGMALVVLPSSGAARQPGDAYRALPGRHGHGEDPVALLQRFYPATHPVIGVASTTTVGDLDAAAMARGPHVLAALPPESNPASAFGLAWLAHRLRQPDGCP